MNDEIPDWARSCPTGKIKFVSGADARKMFRMAGHRKGTQRIKGSIRPYRCPTCDMFHVSSTGRTNR